MERKKVLWWLFVISLLIIIYYLLLPIFPSLTIFGPKVYGQGLKVIAN